jgi:threonyl-tRNA synthetase
VWLAPIQAIILPVSEKHLDYAQKIAEELKGFRIEIDERNESVGKKIRDAEIQKVPYIIVVGDKEVESGKIALRKRSEGDLGQKSIDEAKLILTEK